MARLSDSSKDRRISVILLAVVALLTSGVQLSCKNRSRAMSAQLRDQVHELKTENEALRLRQQELEIQLKTSDTAAGGLSSTDPAIPVVTRLLLDGASGRRTTPDASGQRPLEIYVTAVDGRNRPIQLAGSMSVKVTRIQEDGPPVELADIQMSPAELRDAWRGGLFGGPTWLVKVPLEGSDLTPDVDSLNVKVFYRDLRTGELLECGDEVDIR